MVSSSASLGRSATAARAREAGGALRGRLLARLLALLSGVLGRLPDGPLHRLAHALGAFLYRVQPARRRLVRDNLRRVCAYLAREGLVGEESAPGRAATDERALEVLVRAAFGHYVRGYLETAIVGSYLKRGRLPDIQADQPALVERVFGDQRRAHAPGPVIVVGMHFGAIEVPGVWASSRGLRLTAPMETIADPYLQAYLERSRGGTGLRLVPAEKASAELRAALERGDGVALVADRAIGGAGARVILFGSPARLPIGPAALALASGAPAWLVTCRRAGWAGYRSHLERIELPDTGTRRERLAGFMHNQTRAFERAVAKAPEQWWTLFFPIWREDGR